MGKSKSKCSQFDKEKAPKNHVCVSKIFTATKGTPRTVNGWDKANVILRSFFLIKL
jgi:hypothetical protein